MVQIDSADDGTFTIRLSGRAVMTGLTRDQADRLAASVKARSDALTSAAIPRETVRPARRRTWRDLLGFRRPATR